MSGKTTEQRFWEKVDKSSDCWVWTASKQGKYGAFGVDGKVRGAHRISYVLAFGSIPTGMQVLHKCDNTICVKPSHLFLGTQLDNMKDRDRKERGNQPRGEKHRSAKLTEEKVKRIRKEYSRKNTTMRKLAEKYEVSNQAISRVIHFQDWKHV